MICAKICSNQMDQHSSWKKETCVRYISTSRPFLTGTFLVLTSFSCTQPPPLQVHGFFCCFLFRAQNAKEKKTNAAARQNSCSYWGGQCCCLLRICAQLFHPKRTCVHFSFCGYFPFFCGSFMAPYFWCGWAFSESVFFLIFEKKNEMF